MSAQPDFKKTVLVIDDEEMNLKLLLHILTYEGFHVVCARSAEEGLELLRDLRPHLILMDVRLTGMDGLEATRKIKADPALAAIPVVAVSAYAMEDDRRKAAAAGCRAYLTKPFTRNEILDVARKFTSGASSTNGKSNKSCSTSFPMP